MRLLWIQLKERSINEWNLKEKKINQHKRKVYVVLHPKIFLKCIDTHSWSEERKISLLAQAFDKSEIKLRDRLFPNDRSWKYIHPVFLFNALSPVIKFAQDEQCSVMMMIIRDHIPVRSLWNNLFLLCLCVERKNIKLKHV